MITDLPAAFVAETEKQHRKPVQLCHFNFGGTTYYMSDAPVGTADGLSHDYDPVIESWGVLKDTASQDQSLTKGSLDVRSTSISLIITEDYKPFLASAFENGLDNSIVELYQWFNDAPGVDPQLIDTMVAQDPISYSEQSMILKIDIVSVIMRNNPYIWPREDGKETLDIVIGKVDNVPLIDLETGHVSYLSEEIDPTHVGLTHIENGVGFRRGINKIYIDTEVIEYDQITEASINIITRGCDSTVARNHLIGALICHTDSVFDYEICAGAVSEIDNLLANDEPYEQPYTLDKSSNPTTARFRGRPPWLKLIAEDVDPVEPTVESWPPSAVESEYGGGANPPEDVDELLGGMGENTTMSISGDPSGDGHFVSIAATPVQGDLSSVDTELFGGSGSSNQITAVRQYASAENEHYIVYTNTATDDNLDSLDAEKFHGGGTLRYIKATRRDSAGGVIPVGVTGYIGQLFNKDKSALGEYVSTGITVDFGWSNKLFGCRVRTSIIEVDPLGVESVLETVDTDTLSDAWPGVSHDWEGTSREFTLSASNWSDLEDTKIIVKHEMLETNLSNISDLNTYLSTTVSRITFDVEYSPEVGAVGGVIPAGVTGYIGQWFNTDKSDLGTYVETDITVVFGYSCKLFGCSLRTSIIEVKPDGSESVLETIDIDALTDISPGIAHDWEGTSRSFAISAISWEALVNTKIIVKHEMLDTLVSNIDDGSTYVSTYVDRILFDITYTPDVVVEEEAWQEVTGHFSNDMSGYGDLYDCDGEYFVDACYSLVEFTTSVVAATVEREILLDGVVVWSDTVTPAQSPSGGQHIVSTDISSWAELMASKISVRHRIADGTGGPTTDVVTTISKITWEIAYMAFDSEGGWLVPDERVIYADYLTCTVTGTLGADPTPAKVIKSFLEDHSSNASYVDAASFSAMEAVYQADAYYFNGLLKGDIRLHDALRQCLQEGMGKFVYRNGFIGLINYSTYDDIAIDMAVDMDDIYLRSRSSSGALTSTIKNDVTVVYGYNPYKKEYDGKKQVESLSSISTFERQEYRGEYALITSQGIAVKIADYILGKLDSPTSITTLDMFMSAYVLEKGDNVQYLEFVGSTAGHVISIDRAFGQGKGDKMNKYSITIANS